MPADCVMSAKWNGESVTAEGLEEPGFAGRFARGVPPARISARTSRTGTLVGWPDMCMERLHPERQNLSVKLRSAGETRGFQNCCARRSQSRDARNFCKLLCPQPFSPASASKGRGFQAPSLNG